MARKISRRSFGVTAGAAWPGLAWCAAEQTPAANAPPRKQRHVSASQVTAIGGFLGQRLSENNAYIRNFEIEPYVAMLEKAFARQHVVLIEQRL